MKRSTLQTTIIAALTVSITAALAQEFGPGDFDLSWNTIDGGGGASSNGTFEITGTIGQPDAGALSGGGFELTGGFWPGAAPAPVDTCPADVAPAPVGDGLVNVNDLLAVINGWGACPAPPATCQADINDDNVVNVNDLLAVINAWGLCP